MIRYLPYAVVGSILLQALLTPVPIQNNNQYQPVAKLTIVFDLGGVLFETDKYKTLKELGLTNFAWYKMTTGKNPSMIRQKFFEVLNRIQPEGNIFHAHDEEGTELPGLFCEWLAGIKTTKQIQELIFPIIKNNKSWFANSTEQKLVCRLAHIIFTPERFVQTRKLNKDGFEFVKYCKENGHRLCILSNWDSESFALMQERFPDLFELFDHIIISGHYGCLKPDVRIYQKLIEQTGSADQLIFIDDQEENRLTAQACGIQTIDCPQKKVLLGIGSSPDFDFVRTVFAQLKNTVILAENTQQFQSVIH